MLKVYGFSRVNRFAHGLTKDLRILWALEEMHMPFELVGMDHTAGALEAEAFREVSPFQQLPAIDDDGLVLTETAAILIYLAKKSGKLIPSDAAGEAQVVRWSFCAATTVEMPLLNIVLFGRDSKMVSWATKVLADLDRWLAHRELVATDAFTVADILMSLTLNECKDAKLFEPHAHVRAYRDRCLARPAWRRTFDAYCARVEPT